MRSARGQKIVNKTNKRSSRGPYKKRRTKISQEKKNTPHPKTQNTRKRKRTVDLSINMNNRPYKKRKLDLRMLKSTLAVNRVETLEEKIKSNVGGKSGYQTRRGYGNTTKRWESKDFFPSLNNPYLKLKHWEVEDNKNMHKYTDDNDENNIIIGNYTLLERPIEVFSFSELEYDLIEPLMNDDSGWTKDETVELFEKCKKYDLRFVVVQNKLSFKKPLENIKHRYYKIAQALLYLRSGCNLQKSYQHEVFKNPYDVINEEKRKKELKKYYDRDMKDDIKEDVLRKRREITISDGRRKDYEIRRNDLELRRLEYREKAELRRIIIEKRTKKLLSTVQNASTSTSTTSGTLGEEVVKVSGTVGIVTSEKITPTENVAKTSSLASVSSPPRIVERKYVSNQVKVDPPPKIVNENVLSKNVFVPMITQKMEIGGKKNEEIGSAQNSKNEENKSKKSVTEGEKK